MGDPFSCIEHECGEPERDSSDDAYTTVVSPSSAALGGATPSPTPHADAPFSCAPSPTPPAPHPTATIAAEGSRMLRPRTLGSGIPSPRRRSSLLHPPVVSRENLGFVAPDRGAAQSDRRFPRKRPPPEVTKCQGLVKVEVPRHQKRTLLYR
uniref:Uncharacterized protein n=1 Tax=Ananas comosus var. bracteatus TaxID=296719 RepID=A0A6V7PYK3_ANACO|nr:unnamed protein product [Ananas comosus var. bracteatus]